MDLDPDPDPRPRRGAREAPGPPLLTGAQGAVGVGEALAALLDGAVPQPSLRLPLLDAVGHLLAEEVRAPWPLPRWTAASMDGYAVLGRDVAGASPDDPRRLPLAGGAPAGAPPPPPLPAGAAWRVATGGRIPAGADSVIRQEDTTLDGDRVVIADDRDVGRNLRPEGGDLAAGALALRQGTVIGPGQVALLAALGVAAPLVVRSPRVTVLTSGDELVALDHAEAAAIGTHLPDVNAPMLAALVGAAGGVAEVIGPLPDGQDALVEAVRGSGADLVVSAGAVSVGEHDHVPGAMAALGAELLFRRVRLRPGGPTTAAVLPDGRPWLALPGNPVSALVTWHLLGRPLLRALTHDPAPVAPTLAVTLAEPVERHPRLDLYPRVVLDGVDSAGRPRARLTGPQGSWVTTSIARADGIVRIEAGEGTAGEAPVDFLPF